MKLTLHHRRRLDKAIEHLKEAAAAAKAINYAANVADVNQWIWLLGLKQDTDERGLYNALTGAYTSIQTLLDTTKPGQYYVWPEKVEAVAALAIVNAKRVKDARKALDKILEAPAL